MTFRIDRLATLYIADSFRRSASGEGTRIPILMYHSIADEDESGLSGYYRTATSPTCFEEHMAVIHDCSYDVVGLPEAVSQLSEKPQQDSKLLAITFDDGYRNFYSNAYPVLQKYGFTATMYLPTAHIGDTNRVFKSKECLSWREVRELKNSGISFGSHTVNHPQLYSLSMQEIREELTTSKAVIEDKIGSKIDSFAYPYAFPETDKRFKSDLRQMLFEAGYQSGVCTTVGLAGPVSDPLFLERLPVNSADDERLFRAKLRGAYDWIRKPQYLVKVAKHWGNSLAAHK